jgi:hypothetical protein
MNNIPLADIESRGIPQQMRPFSAAVFSAAVST